MQSPNKDPRTKYCSSCRTEKSVDEFYKRNRRGRQELQGRCKVCCNSRRWENGRFRDDADRERVRTANRASYQRHKESYKKRAFEYRIQSKLAGLALLGGRCRDCEEDHPLVLEFHHKDPTTKEFEVSKALLSPAKYPWEVIKAEIMKCDLLCANCHALEHLSYSLVKTSGVWQVLDANTKGEKFRGEKEKAD